MSRPLLAGLLLGSAAFFPHGASAQQASEPPAIEAEPAAPGTVEEAEALREALAAYLTEAPFDIGLLRIEPDEAGQRIVLDPAELLSGLLGSPIEISPISWVVSERADGNWNFFSDDPVDGTANFELDGEWQENEYRQDWQRMKGIFSPDLGTFLTLEGAVGPTTQVGRDEFSSTIVGFTGATVTMNAEPAQDGAADIAFHQRYDTYAQSVVVRIPMEEEDGEPFGFSFDMTMADMETSGTVRASRTRPLLDLYALLLSHAEALAEDAAAVLAGPEGDEIREQVRAVLPLWEEMDVAATATDFVVQTPYGEMTVAASTQTVRMSGLDSEAFFETELTMEGIGTNSPILPEWAEQFLPRSMGMRFALSDADLATPLEIALREADFAREQPLSDETLARMLEAFQPERLRAVLDAGRIESDILAIAFEGDLAFADERPDGRLNVEATGLDETIAALQAAAAQMPDLYQAIGMLQIAKGFGQDAGDGRTVWLLEAASDGSVSVNGAMLKGPDEEEEPESDEL